MVSPTGPQPARAERRIAELGIELPPVHKPLGAYVESVQTGNLLYLSGVLPVIGHEPKFIGRLGREYNVEQGREATRLATLNMLSAARNHLDSLDKITRVVKLTVYLATAEDFFAQPKVADAASGVLRDVFGEDKLSVRMVLGVPALHSECRSLWKSFSRSLLEKATAFASSSCGVVSAVIQRIKRLNCRFQDLIEWSRCV